MLQLHTIALYQSIQPPSAMYPISLCPAEHKATFIVYFRSQVLPEYCHT